MVVVTGATGLVGSHLLWFLLQKNERVCALRRNTSSLVGIAKVFSFYTTKVDGYLNKIDWIIADVMDENSLMGVIHEGDKVYHCAAVVNLSSGSDSILETNISGTRNVVNVCLKKNVGKLCYVSSIATCVGDENGIWQDSPEKSVYSRSKNYSEQEIWKGISKGLNAVIVNPGVILGPFGVVSGSAALFERVRNGLPVYTLGGSGYVDVRDVVQPMIALMESDIKSERFILVSENIDNKFLLDTIADGFGKNRPFIRLTLPVLVFFGYLTEILFKILPGNPPFSRSLAFTACKREYYSSQKIKNALKYEFIPIQQSIREICKFLN